MGENVAAVYLQKHGFSIVDRNVNFKTGELDLVARKGDMLHIVEVKAVLCEDFPVPNGGGTGYDPADNLHPYKIRKVARTAEWYVLYKHWEGDWQVDGVLVWLRARDRMARVEYLPQIL